MSWPVLMAYNQNGAAIPYSGQWNDQALTSFILTLLRPLKRIYQPEDLVDLMHNHDTVMVSYMDMSQHQAFYNIYLQTAIKWLERDPDRDVGFAVVTGDSRNSFDVGIEPSLRMYLWNDTLEYDSRTWKPSLLMQWISTNMYTVSAWVAPSGSKSTQLRSFVNKGPVLILFTPRNLYDEANDAYAMVGIGWGRGMTFFPKKHLMLQKHTKNQSFICKILFSQLRQISFEYNNCLNDSWVMDLSRVYSHQRRQECHKKFDTVKSECEKLFSMEKSDFTHCASVAKKTFVNLVNSSKFNHVDTRTKDQFCSIGTGRIQDQCPYSQSVKSNFLHMESKGPSRVPKLSTSMLNVEQDGKSAKNTKRLWDNIRCRINHLSQALRSDIFYDSLIDKVFLLFI